LVGQGLYTSNSRLGSHVSSWKKNSDELITAGYTIYIGAKGGNQLAIYDKLRERLSAGHEVDTECWNRYEMRFVQEKAYAVLEHYYLALETSKDFDFKQLVQALLRDFMDLKDPNDKNSRIRRKATDPRWLMFLESVSKIDIEKRIKEPPSLEKKFKWFNNSMGSTMTELILAKDFHGMQRVIYESILDAIDTLDSKKLSRINEYMKEHENDAVDDDRLAQVKNMIKSILDLD
jgi:hypothetical protein